MVNNLDTLLVDANVLVGLTKRTLIFLTNEHEDVNFRVSNSILEEVRYSLQRIRIKRNFSAEEAAERAKESIELIRSQFGQVQIVDDITHSIFAGDLPDPNDRHVIEAALSCHADYILTDNVKDFPQSVLDPCGLKTITPDSYFAELFEKYPEIAIEIMENLNEEINDPVLPHSKFLDTLDTKIGMTKTANALRQIKYSDVQI